MLLLNKLADVICFDKSLRFDIANIKQKHKVSRSSLARVTFYYTRRNSKIKVTKYTFPFSAMRRGKYKQPNVKYLKKLSRHNFLISWGKFTCYENLCTVILNIKSNKI